MTAEGPRFGATPQNPDLLRWIGVQVLLLVLAWVIGMVVRRLLDFAEASDPPGGLRAPGGVPGDDPAVRAPRVPEGPQG